MLEFFRSEQPRDVEAWKLGNRAAMWSAHLYWSETLRSAHTEGDLKGQLRANFLRPLQDGINVFSRNKRKETV